jgi:hypothetical protein
MEPELRQFTRIYVAQEQCSGKRLHEFHEFILLRGRVDHRQVGFHARRIPAC